MQGGYYPGANAYNYGNQMYSVPQQAANGIMVVFVEGEAGARSYPVAAGNTVMLIDFNSSKFWLKATDSNGMPQQLRTFEFKENVPVQQTGNNGGVTREEFETLNEKLNQLIAELGGKG